MDYYKNLDLEDIKYFCDITLVNKIEIWENIPGFDGMYQSSDIGRFKSNMPHNGTDQRILRQCVTKKGYLSLVLYKNKKRHSLLTHRLVAITFIPNPYNLPEVNHIGEKDGIKGNKKDNRVISLIWSTHDDNIEHAVEHSLMQKGEKSHQAKLTEKEVLEIRSNSHLMKTELAEMYNVAPQTISAVIHRKSWKHI